jgi:hypothetical protein
MTKNADGMYTLTLPENADTANAKVIFNNGSAQVPGQNQPGFDYVQNGSATIRLILWPCLHHVYRYKHLPGSNDPDFDSQ